MKYPVRQIAYYTSDIEGAARAHNALYGSGPFFLSEHVPVHDFIHRGAEGRHDHSTAFGQWGDVMVEFFTQHDDAPSHVRDMFPASSELGGLHHMAIIPDDPVMAVKDFEQQGMVVASHFHVAGGLYVTMVDTRPLLGHMTEIYGGEAIANFYAMTRDASLDWDGSDVIRVISFD